MAIGVGSRGGESALFRARAKDKSRQVRLFKLQSRNLNGRTGGARFLEFVCRPNAFSVFGRVRGIASRVAFRREG